MLDELGSDPDFAPSQFWTEINSKNLQMLSDSGIQNFKRSLSQNYFNFQITRPFEHQFVRVFVDWLKSPSLRPFRTTIEKDAWLANVNELSGRRLTFAEAQTYRLFVSFLWDTMLRHDHLKLSKDFREPIVGNPVRVIEGDRILTQDAANSIIECNVVRELLVGIAEPRVAEIGAGYGRLANVFAATGAGTYAIFDIPPALFVSQWYISEAMPYKKIFKFRRFENFADIEDELNSADIAFFSANQIKKFPTSYFDLMLSISTFPEMTPEQVALYQTLFSRLAKKFIFLKQWRHWKNPMDSTFPGMNYVFEGFSPEFRDDPVDPRFFMGIWSKSAGT